ncbi:MAG: Nif3-like dinuclear metal center hexameric protein [Verrucomicrobiae bacterium]|nr:Nif3-like dinuclear metal center hexameric protein [Verrucomicrobiae bacterium]
MAAAPLDVLIRYCDRTLRTHAFTDWPGAVNGLQVQNSGRVTRLAAAVDARRATIELAIEAGANLLVVHHGLFWTPPQPWTGNHYQLLRRLLDHDLAVYSSHLPLDAHPRLGNSIQLARAVGLTSPKPFFETKGQPIGFRAEARLDRDALRDRLAKATGSSPILLPGGPRICRAIGVVTGGAGAELRQAAEAGIDTFITGEGPHWTAALADDLGLNVFYAGHYATETFGVRALTAQLARRFRLPWDFIDCPTGL